MRIMRALVSGRKPRVFDRFRTEQSGGLTKTDRYLDRLISGRPIRLVLFVFCTINFNKNQLPRKTIVLYGMIWC